MGRHEADAPKTKPCHKIRGFWLAPFSIEIENWLWLCLPLGSTFSLLKDLDNDLPEPLDLFRTVSIVHIGYCLYVLVSQASVSSLDSPSSSGKFMAEALIPSLLLSIARVQARVGLQTLPSGEESLQQTPPMTWTKFVEALAIWLFATIDSLDALLLPHGFLRAISGILLISFVLPRSSFERQTELVLGLLVILIGVSISRRKIFPGISTNIGSCLVQSTTWGEFQILFVMGILTALAWVDRLGLPSANSLEAPHVDDYVNLVSLSGVLGCYLACQLTPMVSLAPRVLFQVAVPLLFVESALHVRGYSSITPVIPNCLCWLYEYLASTESGSPRFFGLLYWVIALGCLFLPTWILLPKPSQLSDTSFALSVVMTRKWFHFVAIVLFVPIIYWFPSLMSLGFAIALCVLLVLETLRHDWPILDSFYQTFQDPTKDSKEGMIVSHIFLILGCALPLWISQINMIDQRSSNGESGMPGRLLPYWGVLSLGLGDAMGALIGKGFGTRRWGKNNRTLEGSAAMWSSMMLVGWYCLSPDEHISLVVATTLASLLEAYTTQMDNLVLPLAGATILLILST